METVRAPPRSCRHACGRCRTSSQRRSWPAREPSVAQAHTDKRRPPRRAVTKDRLVLLVEEVLDAPLHFDVPGQWIGDAQIDDVVAVHTPCIRSIVKAMSHMR